MSRIAKLYGKFLAGRPLTFAEFEALIAAFGFIHDRTKDSHRVYKQAGIAERVNAQPDGKDAKPYQVKQFRAIVEAYGLKLDDAE